MGKKTIVSLVLGLSLMVLGGLIFTGALAVNNWDFTKLNQHKYETKTFQFTEDFDNISIKTSTDDIVFKKAEDEKCKVVFYQDQKIKHTAKISDKTLMIGKTDNRKWYDHIEFFSFYTTKITLYLPKEIYSSLNIKTDTGDIKIPDNFNFSKLKINGSTSDISLNSSVTGLAEIRVSTGDIKIDGANFFELKTTTTTGDITLKAVECSGKLSANVSTGDMNLSGVTAETFKSMGDTGNMHLKNVVIKENVLFERSTGDIKFVDSDAGELNIKTDTGDVTGTLLSDKIFITNTETGTVFVPKTEKGDKCEVKTSTGDIKFEISS